MSSSTFLREALAVLTAAGVVLDAALVEVGVVTEAASVRAVEVVLDAALVEVGVVTEAASVRAVEVELEAGMASAADGSVKAGFAPALGMWSVNESDLYQEASIAGVEHVGKQTESCLGPAVTGVGGHTCFSSRARWSCFFLISERVDIIASIFFPMVTARL